MRSNVFSAVIGVLVLTSSPRAQNAGVEFFERSIRPVLIEHCHECHATTSKKVRGGLLVDSRDGMRKGGFTGPAVVPGSLEKSLLIRAVHYTDPDMKMPKKGKLPAAIIADLEAWVKMGAPDPRDKAAEVKPARSWDEIVAERRKWWSLQPVKRSAVPTPKNAKWSDDSIDRFLLSAMEAKGLAPAKDADPHTLIRRLSLVLTGLPPTIEETKSFVKEWSTANSVRSTQYSVLAKHVDRLLASPQFGERWARHWMDVVRFTETHGNEWNYEVHHAWRYRDYLIRAFNDDVPYDQLIREHIAGDLLAKPRTSVAKDKFNESIIGTAFYRFGEVNHDDCIDLRSIGYDLVDNQIDTLSKAFQALTVACARCHDHKLDAISMKDYHGLLGILRSSRQVAHTIDAPDVNAALFDRMRKLKADMRRELADAWLKDRELQPKALAKSMSAFKSDKLPMENPLSIWGRLLAAQQDGKRSFADAWRLVTEEYMKEYHERTRHNGAKFTTLADFRKTHWPDWQRDGQGLRGKPSRAGDFMVAPGNDAMGRILPAGAYTHTLAEKLNGALRSPVLAADKKYISMYVFGERASAVRLVSNGCQLNYRNYRYLTKSEPHWVTFEIPPDADSLRIYAELMTKFDNPKFPDQLGTLGGDKLNYRIPWEQAAADPRSYFGITHAVLHDEPAPPTTSLGHLRGIFVPADNASNLAEHFADRLHKAVGAWQDEQATDEDVHWLEAFRRAGILDSRANVTPRLEKLVAEYRKLESVLALPRIVPGLADFGPGFEQPILARGDCMKPGEKTPRRYVEVLAGEPIRPTGSGRLELANAIAAPDNPLTARVMVNRVWHHLFGAGLVRTVDDFGHVGELPSHPELLDYLAAEFTSSTSPERKRGDGSAGKWSIKRLIRAIVLTRAFRQSHSPSAADIEVDPENRLLSRYPARRMEAEAIRDSLLAASGRLDRALFGPSIAAYRDKDYADRRLFKGPLDGHGRRSLYIKVTLMEPPKFLEVFNFPGGKVCQGRRDVTSTPAQALAMMNDPFVHQQADVWANRLIERKNDSIEARLDQMFRIALSRAPRAAERERLQRYVAQVAESQKVRIEERMGSAAVWREVAHAVFNLQEFISIP